MCKELFRDVEKLTRGSLSRRPCCQLPVLFVPQKLMWILKPRTPVWFAAPRTMEPSIPFQAAEGTGFSQDDSSWVPDCSDLSPATAFPSGSESSPTCPHQLYDLASVLLQAGCTSLSAPPWVNARLRGSCSEPLDQKKPRPSPHVECKQQAFSRNWGRPGRWPGS